jgi:hypothetical protein
MPLGDALCPTCGKRLTLNAPIRIGAFIVGSVISYRTLARTGLRENIFFILWIPLLFLTQIAIIRMISRVLPLPLTVIPEPYEHVDIYSTTENMTPEETRMKRLADSIKNERSETGND